MFLPLLLLGQVQGIPCLEQAKGSVGYLPAIRATYGQPPGYRILQVIDGRNMLVQGLFTVWITEFDTDEFYDDQFLDDPPWKGIPQPKLPPILEVIGKQRYTTALGATRTVVKVRPRRRAPVKTSDDLLWLEKDLQERKGK